MYIRITTKCNMTCEHCGFACSPDKGENMSFETFKKAIDLAGESVCLGGGEPTIHPQFEKFLLYAMSHCDTVALVTNGKNKSRALMLAGLAKIYKNNLMIQLSRDPYHEEIDEEVVEVFTKQKMVRNTSPYLVNSGRCDFGEDGCFCPEPIIEPSGAIRHCACDNSPEIGNVYSDNYFEYPECGCYKELIASNA